ncbi:hypothetical protein HWV62_23336 [Athelia sp. TMB]|nr:hypothetical protein HWV62_23336 [Athelia sp. TMB]
MLYLDSRRNLVFREHVNPPVFIAATWLTLDNPVKSDWHGAFDEHKWLFLPDTAALHEAHQYVADVLSWRENAESPRVEDFNLKWPVSGSHDYRFIPIAGLERESFAREDIVYCHPYRSLPTISCHITPLFAIINAAITLENHTLRDLVVSYSKDTDEQAELEHKLDIVRKIWALFTSARSAARNCRFPAQVAAIRTTDKAQHGALAALQQEDRQEAVEDSQIAQKHSHVRVGTLREHSPGQVAAIRTTNKAPQGAVAALQQEARQKAVEDSQNPLVLGVKRGSVAAAGVSPF